MLGSISAVSRVRSLILPEEMSVGWVWAHFPEQRLVIEPTFMSYCFLFCALYRKESANKRYRNTVNDLISPNTVSQNDEKPHTAELDDTAIPLVKIKITEIPHKKKARYRNTVNPHVPLLV